MSAFIQRYLASAAIVLVLLAATDHGAAPNPDRAPKSFQLGGYFVDVKAEDGRLAFQKKDAEGNAVGEPWLWPEEEDSATRYEEPRLVEKEGGIWLVFLERGADGKTRSRAISLSEIFADGFESANTAAWSTTEPAVNLFFETPASGSAVGDASPPIRVLFATPTGIDIAPETLAFSRDGSPLAVSCSPVSGGAECLPSTPFADGPISLAATIADIAGHVSPTATRTFTIDTEAPAILLTSPASPPMVRDEPKSTPMAAAHPPARSDSPSWASPTPNASSWRSYTPWVIRSGARRSCISRPTI
jgi:hypothetical protein